MNEQQFREISQTISQVGFYLMNLGDISLFKDTPTHRNIVTLLSQMALKLEDVMRDKNTLIASNSTPAITGEVSGNKYITKQQVIDMCHPLITQYGINQAIQTKDIPYIKRGNKYFFVETEVKDWIDKKRSNNDDTVRTSHKFV